jgi:hypothetical protein
MVERFGGKVPHAGSLPFRTRSKRFSLQRRPVNEVRRVVTVLGNILCERLQKSLLSDLRSCQGSGPTRANVIKKRRPFNNAITNSLG